MADGSCYTCSSEWVRIETRESYVLKRSTGFERVIWFAKRVPVPAEAVVVDSGELLFHQIAVTSHSASKQEVYLFRYVERGLGVLHVSAKLAVKDPPRDSMSYDRGPASLLIGP